MRKVFKRACDCLVQLSPDNTLFFVKSLFFTPKKTDLEIKQAEPMTIILFCFGVAFQEASSLSSFALYFSPQKSHVQGKSCLDTPNPSPTAQLNSGLESGRIAPIPSIISLSSWTVSFFSGDSATGPCSPYKAAVNSMSSKKPKPIVYFEYSGGRIYYTCPKCAWGMSSPIEEGTIEKECELCHLLFIVYDSEDSS